VYTPAGIHVPSKKKSAAPIPSARLTRDDWLDAAFQAVVDGGFDQVRVLVLADKLGVTRGSFYWHFTDHAALVQALLERWQAQEIERDQRLQAQASDDPLEDLERLLDAALAHAGVDMENIRFELALRTLGRSDAAVAAMLVEVDRVRMTLFEQKFVTLTRDPQMAHELAALFYLAIVGSHQALSRPTSPPTAKAFFKSIIGRYLIHQQAPRPKPVR
jgi:AcrR family transcriptional regulator